MTQSAVIPANGELIATGPAICNQPGCTEVATHGYTWAWGEMGTCCARHQQTLAQLGRNLKRTIQFNVLSSAPPTPMSRDERTRLKAELLVSAEELTEAKQRAAELYRNNAELASQLQALTVRHRETEAQLKDARGDLLESERARDKVAAELAALGDEMQRFQLIASAHADMADRLRDSEARAEHLEIQRDEALRQRDMARANVPVDGEPDTGR